MLNLGKFKDNQLYTIFFTEKNKKETNRTMKSFEDTIAGFCIIFPIISHLNFDTMISLRIWSHF